MEWVAGCGGATQASTPTGVVFGGTRDTRCPPGGSVLWEPARFGPALAPQGATQWVRPTGTHKVPLAPYDGKSDLRAYLAQFEYVCRGTVGIRMKVEYTLWAQCAAQRQRC